MVGEPERRLRQPPILPSRSSWTTPQSECAALAPFAKLKVIRNRENLGFTKANNRGVAAAQGEYLLFLNSDTRISPDTLARLVGFADEHPQAGAVGPLVLNRDAPSARSGGSSLC
jgi:GT2 family glycosyltransferase